MDGVRLLLCIAVSLAAHGLLLQGLRAVPQRPSRPERVTVRVVAPPPPPAEPPAPPPPPPPQPSAVPPPQPLQQVRRSDRPLAQAQPRPQPQPADSPQPPADTPPTERLAEPSADTTDTPVFGVSLESTSQAGSGPTVAVGNSLQVPQQGAAKEPRQIKPLAAPAAAHEVETMPVIRGSCAGKYTDAARDAGVEGTVVLDVVVSEDGSTRDIAVVQGLGHGLDEAAVEALRRCRFQPGTKNGQAVAVRVRAFKVRFFAADAP